jgi:HAD superfamily hydrolase (TIGR01509 family)
MAEILKNIEAVLFDLDGTLVDSMWMWRTIDIEYLARFGIEMPSNLQEEIAGISVTQTAVYFQKAFGITDSVGKIISDWDAMARQKYKEEVPLKPGTLAFLKDLKEKNIPCAIATSNSRTLTEEVLQSHKIKPFFKEIITGEDIHKGKPDPDVYLECARCLGISPEKCLVFEDIPYGILAGKRAGMKVCAIEEDYAKEDVNEVRALADYYICSYEDILNNTYECLNAGKNLK